MWTRFNVSSSDFQQVPLHVKVTDASPVYTLDIVYAQPSVETWLWRYPLHYLSKELDQDAKMSPEECIQCYVCTTATQVAIKNSS